MLTQFFYNLLVFFCWLIPGHYVWVAIVLITILLRLAFLKPSIKMVETQHKQKKLQPHLDRIKTEHAADKQAQQKAIMELYKKEGVNPLGGCLPMIIQLIVLIGFYRVFTQMGLGLVKVQHLYSFIPKLSVLNSSFFGIDLAKTVAVLTHSGGATAIAAYLFPIIVGGTQLIQSLQARAMQPKTAGGQGESFQKALNAQFTYLFPLMAAYISYTLSAALSIYWITQTVFMIAQQKYAVSKLQRIQEVVSESGLGKAKEIASGPRSEIFKKGDVVVEVKKKE